MRFHPHAHSISVDSFGLFIAKVLGLVLRVREIGCATSAKRGLTIAFSENRSL
jgi:hypothetical protein